MLNLNNNNQNGNNSDVASAQYEQLPEQDSSSSSETEDAVLSEQKAELSLEDAETFRVSDMRIGFSVILLELLISLAETKTPPNQFTTKVVENCEFKRKNKAFKQPLLEIAAELDLLESSKRKLEDAVEGIYKVINNLKNNSNVKKVLEAKLMTLLEHYAVVNSVAPQVDIDRSVTRIDETQFVKTKKIISPDSPSYSSQSNNNGSATDRVEHYIDQPASFWQTLTRTAKSSMCCFCCVSSKKQDDAIFDENAIPASVRVAYSPGRGGNVAKLFGGVSYGSTAKASIYRREQMRKSAEIGRDSKYQNVLGVQ